MLSNLFRDLCAQFTSNTGLIETNWQELVTNYSAKERHYHTLAHLENLVNEIGPLKQEIQNRFAVLFALFYHDIIYVPGKKDNEEESAKLAAERMAALGCDSKLIGATAAIIRATSTHLPSGDSDSNLFTDADLSILGQEEETYNHYAQQIRKEFSVYPDFIYNPGRKQVLQHFLSMNRIYKTSHFYNKYEKMARRNLQQEISLL